MKNSIRESFNVRKSWSKGYASLIGVIAVAIVMIAIPTAVIAESGLPEPSIEDSPEEPYTDELTLPEDQTVTFHQAKAKANGKSHIILTWSKVKDADGYTVYRSSDADKLGKKIYTTNKASIKSYKDKDAAVHKHHWYTVKAWEKDDGDKTTITVIKAKKVKNALKYKSSTKFKTYAYSGGGTTASGKKAQVGRVAVDPNVIDLGTWLYIEDYGLCQAADTGGAIKGNKIDLYMDSEAECVDWGIRHKKVYILE
ncbi:MAG: 3D domain-containing protein [Clostridiales Family XIII bacterium]|jgi:3D (Asp-Asp-Asp) domain-containing protein|nr:3D domain-containing protein [Clostridiales Family XIII bacterium]